MTSPLILTFAAVPALFLAGAASAQSPPSATTAQRQPKTLDPNEVICQKQEVVGSRLATRRVCLTRLQWQEKRAQDRQDTVKAQIPAAKNAPGG